MDTGNLLLIGGLGVGGYLAWRWYAGPGGYSDQQLCGTSMTAAQLQSFAASIIASAAASGLTPTAYLAAIPATTSNQQQLACARVAIAQYPTGAAASATATASAAATVASSTPAAASPGAAAATPAPATPTAAASGPSLDSIYQALASAASAGGVNLTTGMLSGGQPCDSNGWNYFLSQVYALPGGAALPGGLFPSSTDGQPMTLAAYWGVMAPWLASSQGLSGLGIFGGLGAIARRQRGY